MSTVAHKRAQFLAVGLTEAQADTCAEHRDPLRDDAGFAWRLTDSGQVWIAQRGIEYLVDRDGTITRAA